MGQGASIATANDEGGRARAGRIAAIAFDAGHADFHTVRALPAGEGADWNDALRSGTSPTPCPRPAGQGRAGQGPSYASTTAWKHEIYVHGVFASEKATRPFAEGERLLGWHGEGPLALGYKRWDPEFMALEPDKFLKSVDQERRRFGWKAALGLWLDLHDQGFMDIGIDASTTVGARERFQAAYDKY